MQIFIIANIVLAVVMIAVILIQQDKSGGAGAALSGGAGSVFGGGGSASFLAKVTATLALLFFLNSMTIAYIANNASGSSIELSTEALEATDAPEIQAEESDIPSVNSSISIDATASDIPSSE